MIYNLNIEFSEEKLFDVFFFTSKIWQIFEPLETPHLFGFARLFFGSVWLQIDKVSLKKLLVFWLQTTFINRQSLSLIWVVVSIFFMFTPKIGEDEPILTSIFFKGVVQPPTSYVSLVHLCCLAQVGWFVII